MYKPLFEESSTIILIARQKGYFKNTRIPRKLKKKVKKVCKLFWDNLDNGQRLWFYLGKVNSRHRDLLISKICK